MSPRRRSATRTAIDPVSGRAATGQLFSYEALAAGQRFAGTLEIDDAVDHEVVTRIREALSGTVRLGRSKASEYGRARIAIGEGDAYETWRAEAARGAGDLAILCLSDFAPSDPARIDAAEFGLAAGDLDWGRSFVRTRVFAPFNAALRACEPDRVVFERGSVLLFENARHEGDAIFYGGRFREAGFGQIWVDPAWLRTEHPSSPPEARISFVPENRSIVALPQALAIAVRASAELLEFRASTVSAQGAHVAWAQEKALDLGRLYDAAAAYAGGVAGAVGPGSSQWGRVKDAAEKATTIEDLRVRLFGDKGVCRRIQKGEARADAEWSAGAQRTAGDAKTLVFESFADWMEKRLDEGKSIEAMRQLARECGRIAQNYRRREAIGA